MLNSGTWPRIVQPADYVTVAASQDDQRISATGAVGNLLYGLLIIPGTTSPGAVVITDGDAGPDITIFAGGATSVADLKPFFIQLGVVSQTGGWVVTTGANVTVIAVGLFT